MDWGGRAPGPDSGPRRLPSSSPTRLVAGNPPGAGWQLVSCPESDLAPPAPCTRPGRHSCGCDRRLGSDSPRHIPGPATIFFFFFFGDSFSHTPNPHPPFPQKCSVSPQRVPLGGGSWREMRPGFPGTCGAGVPVLGGGKLLAAEQHPPPNITGFSGERG